MDTLGTRIARFRKYAQMTQAQLADACGWENGQGRIGNYEKDKREPTLSDMRNICRVLGCTLVQLIEGTGDGDLPAVTDDCDFILSFDHLNCADYAEQREIATKLVFPKRLIRELNGRLENFRYALVSDSSMDPTIRIDDHILFDTSLKTPEDKKVFAVLVAGGKVTTRRFFQLMDGTWIARADNSDKRYYPDESYSNVSMIGQKIIGSVIWRGGRI